MKKVSWVKPGDFWAVIAIVFILSLLTGYSLYFYFHKATNLSASSLDRSLLVDHPPMVLAQSAYGAPKLDQINLTQLFDLTNQARQNAHLKPLIWNPKLNQSAQYKCNDMVQRNYWSHYAPDGTSPYYFIEAVLGDNWRSGAENLANGYSSSKEVVAAWLNSPSHSASLLNNSYTDVGFGVCVGSNSEQAVAINVVQHFISR